MPSLHRYRFSKDRASPPPFTRLFCASVSSRSSGWTNSIEGCDISWRRESGRDAIRAADAPVLQPEIRMLPQMRKVSTLTLSTALGVTLLALARTWDRPFSSTRDYPQTVPLEGENCAGGRVIIAAGEGSGDARTRPACHFEHDGKVRQRPQWYDDMSYQEEPCQRSRWL